MPSTERRETEGRMVMRGRHITNSLWDILSVRHPPEKMKASVHMIRGSEKTGRWHCQHTIVNKYLVRAGQTVQFQEVAVTAYSVTL